METADASGSASGNPSDSGASSIGSSSPNSSDDTRARLIRAATELFAKNGFDGTSIKDLASHAGVNVSLVSYHFGGKEGLYRACVEQFGQERLAMASRLLQGAATLE